LSSAALALLALCWLATLSSCNKSTAAEAGAPTPPARPRWEAVLDPTPELLVVIRPQAVRRDRMSGPLVRQAIELARERSRLVTAVGALQAMEDAEEVIVGAREGDWEEPREIVIVVRGVRADIDPAGLVDETGRALWVASPREPSADVRELRAPADERTSEGDESAQGPIAARDASLFELPGRTWVIATGNARARARDLFARAPAGPPTTALELPQLEGSALRGCDTDGEDDKGSRLALVRLNGPALVAHLRALRPPALLAPVGRELASVTIVLLSGENGENGVLRAALTYDRTQAVAPAEATVREALAALLSASQAGQADQANQANQKEYAWMRSATVHASRSCLVVTVGCR
jgi:hypothetical protein